MTIEEARTFLDNLKVCIEEHPIVADWLVEIADRKTEPTCSKMEQVDKDINVRSKDCETCKWGEDKHRYAHICNECGVGINNYEPKDEPQTELVNDSPILVKDLVDDEFNPYDEECMRCKHLKLQCEFVPSYCKYEPRDEPHIVGKHADVIIIDESRLTAKCLNCANGGSYKCSKCDGEMYYKYDKDEPQIDNLATAIAHGAYCRTCKHLFDEDCDCDVVFTGYEPKDEPQADWYWRCPKCDHIVPNEFDECVWCLAPKPKVVMPKECKGCDSASKIIESYSRGFEDGAEAVKAVQTDCSWK